MTQYQPKNYVFNMTERTLFDATKVPKGIQVLNGDVGEEDAKNQAKTYVSQLQSDKAHAQYHMIQSLHTDMDVSDGELLHAPIWLAKYDHKGKAIVLVIDARHRISNDHDGPGVNWSPRRGDWEFPPRGQAGVILCRSSWTC